MSRFYLPDASYLHHLSSDCFTIPTCICMVHTCSKQNHENYGSAQRHQRNQSYQQSDGRVVVLVQSQDNPAQYMALPCKCSCQMPVEQLRANNAKFRIESMSFSLAHACRHRTGARTGFCAAGLRMWRHVLQNTFFRRRTPRTCPTGLRHNTPTHLQLRSTTSCCTILSAFFSESRSDFFLVLKISSHVMGFSDFKHL